MDAHEEEANDGPEHSLAAQGRQGTSPHSLDRLAEAMQKHAPSPLHTDDDHPDNYRTRARKEQDDGSPVSSAADKILGEHELVCHVLNARGSQYTGTVECELR